MTYLDVTGQRGSPVFPISFRVAWFRPKGMEPTSSDGRMSIGASVDKGSELEALVHKLRPRIVDMVHEKQDQFFPRDSMAKRGEYRRRSRSTRRSTSRARRRATGTRSSRSASSCRR